MFAVKMLSHCISSSPILIHFHLPYRIYIAKSGSSHELTERAKLDACCYSNRMHLIKPVDPYTDRINTKECHFQNVQSEWCE